MGRESELNRLEKYIERLLGGYADLKSEKQRLEQELTQQQAENKRLRQVLDSMDVERGAVRDRVSSLIERIEHWQSEVVELSAESEKDDSDSEEEVHDNEPVELEGLESMEEGEAEPLDQTEQGGRIQGSLFSS